MLLPLQTEYIERRKTKGRVRWFKHELAYGFITEEGFSEDIFVHYQSLQMPGFKSIRAGQRVMFERCVTDDGDLVAINVVPIKEKHAKHSPENV
ncbi:MAG: cold shock domain-containing protein [Bradymonadales bacterium]|jgi:CspA family cold shock protein